MPLKYKYTKKDEIPAELAAHYVEREGVFVLDAEGVVEREKLDEFRATNKELLRLLGVSKPADALAKLAKIKDVDPDLYEKLKKEHADAEEKNLKTRQDFEDHAKRQREAMLADHQKALNERDEKAKALAIRLEKVLIDEAVATEAIKKGVRPTAIPDVQARARRVYRLDGDEIKAFDGENEKFGKDGGVLKIGDWMEGLTKDAPHLFGETSGSDSSSGGGGEFSDANNPYSTATLNRTAQAKIEATNPTLAKRLQASAKK
jgi:hypothetical protein